MSIQAVGEVLETDIGEVAAKMLLISIANAHNKSTGLCCPSIDRLAKETGMGRSTVKRWLRWLEQHRFIRAIPTHAENGRQQANSYLLTLGEGSNLDPSEGPDLGPVQFGLEASSGPGEGPSHEPLEGSNCEPPLKEPEEYRKKERERVRVDFEEVWSVYPRRRLTNRAEAEEAFKALSDHDTHRCLAAAQRIAQWHLEDAKDRGEDPSEAVQFRTGLGKWIRSGAFADALALQVKAKNTPDTDWVDRVRRFRTGEINWPHGWGPKPGEPGCKAITTVKSGDPLVPFLEQARGRKFVFGDRGVATITVEVYEQALALRATKEAA